MKVFSYLYDKAILLSKTRNAVRYLSAVSFFESVILPFPPPDVILAPMSLANPKKALYYARITTIFSVLGGILGYVIGYLVFESIYPWIVKFGYEEKIESITSMFNEYGVWIVFIAGFSPIPYKLFTLSAGAASMSFLPFVLASFLGRGIRFFLVAYVMKIGGEKFEPIIKKFINMIGWFLLFVIGSYIVFKTI